ncbi:MAG: hypothetical protein AB1938_25670 [Myxococcota bacterium]
MKRALLLLLCLFAGCGRDAPVDDAGVDAGLDAGHTTDASTDAGWRCIAARASCDWPGRWNVVATLAPSFDAGGFSPCLPLPPLEWEVALLADGGASWCSTSQVSWADDAGCRLFFHDGFTTTNPSETYNHSIDLALSRTDGGVTGDGAYTLRGGSNCAVPLIASGGPAP